MITYNPSVGEVFHILCDIACDIACNSSSNRFACVSDDTDPKHAKKMEKELKKMEKKEAGDKKTLKGTAKAVSLAKQLSPKTQRKKDKLLNSTSQLKVRQGVRLSTHRVTSFLSQFKK